jgi:oligosaccharide repeat unit polymerase
MIPAVVGFVIIALLLVLNLYLGRSFLYPPSQFSLLWTVLIGLSMFIGGLLFPLSVHAVCIYCVGAIAFSAGGAFRLAVGRHTPQSAQPGEEVIEPYYIYWPLTAALIILVFLLPVYWRYMISIADPQISNIWWGIRAGVIAMSEMQGPKPWQQTLFDNITVITILLALTAAAHYGERGFSRWIAAGLIIVATAYNLATASRAGASVVVLGALGIGLLRRRRISWRLLFVGFLGVLVMYVPLTILRAKGGNIAELAADDMRLLRDIGLLYTVGPLIAFDSYLQDPAMLSRTWSISYFFLQTASRFGLDVNAPSTHMGYVAVGPLGNTNVYTMYFAYYPEFGFSGVILLTALVGYCSVWLYQAAQSCCDYLLILFGISFHEVCKTGFSEGFFLGLNMWIKAAGYCVVIYSLHRMAAARRVGRASCYQQPEDACRA